MDVKTCLSPPAFDAPRASPDLGEIYFDNIAKTLKWWDGTQWIDARGSAIVKTGNIGSPDGEISGVKGSVWIDTLDPGIWQNVDGGYQWVSGFPPKGGNYPQVLTKMSAEDYDTAWQTPTTPLPIYGQGQLPIYATDGAMCLFYSGNGATPANWVGLYSSSLGGWYVLNQGLLDANGMPTQLASATGWRKPTTTLKCALTYQGGYMFEVYGEVTPSVAGIVGLGISQDTYNATSEPWSSAYTYAPTANQKYALTTQATYLATSASWTGFDVRGYNSVAGTLSFARVNARIRPVWVKGVA